MFQHVQSQLSRLNQSMFKFASPALEAAFETHCCNTVGLWIYGGICNFLLGWAILVPKMLGRGRDRCGLLPSIWPPFLLHFLPATTLLAALLFVPSWYTSHRRKVNLVMIFAFTLNIDFLRRTILWMPLAGAVAPPPAAEPSMVQSLQMFANESFFFISMWQVAAIFGNCLPFEFAAVTLGMLLDISGNNRICVSPLLSPSPATISPRFRSAAENASDVMLLWAVPYHHKRGQPIESCAALFAFWQVLGWFMACLAMLVADVLRRRSFLRTNAARTMLGPDLAAAADTWPFGNIGMISRLVATLIALWFATCLTWAVALDTLS